LIINVGRHFIPTIHKKKKKLITKHLLLKLIKRKKRMDSMVEYVDAPHKIQFGKIKDNIDFWLCREKSLLSFGVFV